MNRHHSYFSIFVLTMTFATGFALAGPGHDHGHDESPATTAGPASPRFEAHSDLFEAVGVLQGDELSVFIDRYADNAPVLNATVELESGTLKATGQFHAEHGDYSFPSKAFDKPGSYPVTLTVTAAEDVDILAANLVVPEEAPGHEHSEQSTPVWHQYGRTWGVGAAVLLALGWIASRLISRRKGGVQK